MDYLNRSSPGPQAFIFGFSRTPSIGYFLILFGSMDHGQTSGWIVAEESAGIAMSLGQLSAILLIYDFMFYWVHRVFHHPFLMRHVHYVHHRVRHPAALDDYYLHPVDALWVTTLFFLSVTIVGPVDSETFIATFFIWILINNFLHRGLNLPHPAFKLTNYWSRMHDCHHSKKINSNFGSLFPFWDMMFGTYYIDKDSSA